ncbi:Zn-ribbon domain-containing OB-fold protein [Nocardia vermiculata]|uniref:DUF35 domain-containing protein n=1 Tax=Nocardia vermiculata TaxID=257274 RepID=A0A846Y202_9NOCA|nr:OB-fold domain-containing protein [Nocardia vermiculata]NKY51934.1 hypothetical protein [Nocardia vermiculata]
MSDRRPLPLRYPEDIEHLDGAANSLLRIPRCRTCDRRFWPPGPVCPHDFTSDIGWDTDPGTGRVNSWVRFHKQYFAGDEVPYIVVQVRLDSGPNITTTWAGDAEPVIGEPVSVSFRTVDEHTPLPEFGPVVRECSR